MTNEHIQPVSIFIKTAALGFLQTTNLLAILSGCVIVALSPHLLSLQVLALLLLVSASLWPLRKNMAVQAVIFLLLAVVFSSARSHWALQKILPETYSGQHFRLMGEVVGLPETNNKRQKFTLRVTSMVRVDGTKLKRLPPASQPARVQLSFYHGPYGSQHKAPVTVLRPGQRLDINVVLKRPRGLLNPGGFDYQSYLLSRGVDASGYVRKLNHLTPAKRMGLRWQLQTMVESQGLPQRRLMAGLLLGDRSGLGVADWDLFKTTGTSHLIAISGLHIGLIAAVAALFGQLLGRLLLLLPRAHMPSKYFAVIASIGAALFYSYLSGFSIPTQRALIMLVATHIGVLAWGAMSVTKVFLLALIAVLLLDPFALSQMGLSLSFCAVLALLYGFMGRSVAKDASKLKQYLWFFVKSQLLVLVFMLPVLFSLSLPVSLVAPLSNFIAIPLLGFVILPSLLLGVLEQLIFATHYCWQLADYALALLLEWLGLLSNGIDPVFFSPWPWSLSLLVLLSLFALLLFLPKGIKGRYLALLLLPLLIWPTPPFEQNDSLEITVLDVGQGLAVVLRKNNTTMVYDTGPYFSAEFNAGSHIIAPFLRHQGVRALDRLVVSHSDKDHRGGLVSLMTEFPLEQLLLEPHYLESFEFTKIRLAGVKPQLQRCYQGQSFDWQGVSIKALWPPPNLVTTSNNNRSCVLLLEYGTFTMLLAGDIEKPIEHVLAPSLSPVDLLLAPHHGSKTSSSSIWVNATRPRWAVVSAAFKGRYGHPHRSVVERYQNAGSEVINTAEQGAVQFLVGADGGVIMTTERNKRRRFYH